MNPFQQATAENFPLKFDVLEILNNSIFYPASGIDGTAIKLMHKFSKSFVHVDYSMSKDQLYNALENDLILPGYQLIGSKEIDMHELNPSGDQPELTFTPHEKNRLKMDFIHQRFKGEMVQPFALWSVFEWDESQENTVVNPPKYKQISLLHIAGEAAITFEILYRQNKINPKGVVLIDTAEGIGDNWTEFTNPNARLFQSIQQNALENKIPMPPLVLERALSIFSDSVWPSYEWLDFFTDEYKRTIILSKFKKNKKNITI